MESVSSEAFHCIIALGYGIESEEIGSIVEGLAYFCSFFLSHGKIDLEKVPESNKYLIEIVLEASRYKFPKLTKDRFTTKMEEVIIKDFPFDIHPNEKTIQELKNLTVYVFTFTGADDFFILHTCTSLKALSSVLNIIKDENVKKLAIAHYWRSYIYAYICQGTKPIIEKYKKVTDSWETIIEKAINNEEEHIFKLVQVCHENMLEYGDESLLFQYCAQEANKITKFKF